MNFDPQLTWIFFSSHIPMAGWTLACSQVVISSLSAILWMVFFFFGFVLKHKHHCNMPIIFICSYTFLFCHTWWTLSCTAPQVLHGGNLILFCFWITNFFCSWVCSHVKACCLPGRYTNLQNPTLRKKTGSYLVKCCSYWLFFIDHKPLFTKYIGSSTEKIYLRCENLIEQSAVCHTIWPTLASSMKARVFTHKKKVADFLYCAVNYLLIINYCCWLLMYSIISCLSCALIQISCCCSYLCADHGHGPERRKTI